MAEDLKESNREREALLAANSSLKRERLNEETKLRRRSSVILNALEELADLEQTLSAFNNRSFSVLE